MAWREGRSRRNPKHHHHHHQVRWLKVNFSSHCGVPLWAWREMIKSNDCTDASQTAIRQSYKGKAVWVNLVHAFLPHAHEVDQRSLCQFSSHIWMHNNNNNNNNVNKRSTLASATGFWCSNSKSQSNQSGSQSWSSTWLSWLEEIYIYI